MRFLRLTSVAVTALSGLLMAACQPTGHSTDKSNTVQGLKSAQENAQAVTETMILYPATDGWRTHGGNYAEDRFSALDKIDSENVDKLGLAWSYELGTSRGIEATPIIHNGIMYVTSTWNIVHAMDAKTGEPLWAFDPEIDKEQAAKGCCDVVNRGVAIWGENVYTATMDGRLIALNARTGAKSWDIQTIDKSKPYTITGAPRIIKGKVMIGNGGAELGVRGYFSAYDAETGEMIWRFYTVPGNPKDGFENETMRMAAETWTGEWWASGGGGTAWDSMAYDPELDLLYVGVGNGSPWNQAIRSPEGGDNLFLSSIVAVRPDTGEYVWHYQTTPGETWDYTATQHMILADLEIEGQTRQVIMQAPKNGFFYVIDRATGEFISANNFVPVNWATSIDPETGRPIEVPEARYGTKEPYFQTPGPLGAHNWHPMAYNPQTNLVYIPAQETFWLFQSREGQGYTGTGWNTGADFEVNSLPTDKAIFKALKASLKGRLIAWDPVKQEQAWAFEHVGPWNGGILSTAGNLVFQGTSDAHFAAYDAATGERKWRYFSQTGIVAAPVTYEIDGTQYIAVASGWGGAYALGYGGVLPTGSATQQVGRVLVFKIGGTGSLPEVNTVELHKPDIPETINSKAVLKIGSEAYAHACVTCHGDQAFSSGLVPNLRFSAALADADYWREIVYEGGLAENGMPNFGKIMDEETVEAIREYVISVANSDFNEDFYQSLKPKAE